MRDVINLFSNPLTVNIETCRADFQMELCALQADPTYNMRKETGTSFFKLINPVNFTNIYDFCARIAFLFGSTYICGRGFSYLKYVKNKYRNSLTDSSLQDIACSNAEIDVDKLVQKNPQLSH